MNRPVPAARVDAGRATPSPGRTRILTEALRLFAHQGFAGTSVRQVAAAAGVSAPLVLHHFASKAGLHEAVDIEAMRRVRVALDAGLSGLAQSGRPPDDQVLVGRLVATQGQLVLDDDLRAYVRRCILEGGEHGAALLRRAWDVADAEVRTLLDSGLARPDIDVQETKLHVVLLVFGSWLLPDLDELLDAPAYSPEGISRRMRATVSLLLHGTADRHGPQAPPCLDA